MTSRLGTGKLLTFFYSVVDSDPTHVETFMRENLIEKYCVVLSYENKVGNTRYLWNCKDELSSWQIFCYHFNGLSYERGA